MKPFFRLPATAAIAADRTPTRHAARLALLLLLAGSGCATSMLEQRVVEQFTDALDEENEPALRRIASTRFEEKALRSPDALTDLDVLHLPTDELKVVHVEEDGDDRRKVTVKEASGGKYQFVIVKDPLKERWVVDDVMMRQRSKGTRVTKSTTEVMDLLMTLREFLTTWSDGSREEILAMVSPELRKSLTQLPEEWMTALAARIAANYENGMARKPEAQLNVNDAVVKLPAKQGYLLVSMMRQGDDWLIDDIELINRRQEYHPGSIRRQANAIATVTGFLTAYSAQDRDALRQVTDASLFNGALEFAELSLVPLPDASTPPDEFDIRAYSDNLTIMMPSATDMVRIDVQEQADSESLKAADRSFVIREVTLYERGSQRQRNLSSVFTSPTRANLFLSALQKLDVEMLAQISTADFTQAVWKRIRPETIAMLPVPRLPDSSLQLTHSNMQGQRTDLEFQAPDGTLLTCILLNENGSLKIDDVQYSDSAQQVMSLKTQLSLMTPVVEFSAAWLEQDLEVLQVASSNNFNRLVWSNVKTVPNRSDLTLFAMAGPVMETRISLDRATVVTGSPGSASAKTTLVKEHGFWVIDDVELPNVSGQPVALRQSLRDQVTRQMLNGPAATSANAAHGASPGNLTEFRGKSAAIASSPADRRFNDVSGNARKNPAIRSSANDGAVHGVVGAVVDGTRADSGVNHAVYTRDASPGATNAQPFGFPGDANRGVQRAILTRETPAAGVPIQHAADSETGVQVFGPNATEIAMGRDSANDVSEEDVFGTDFSPPARSDELLRRGVTELPPTAAGAEKPRSRISEPADKPIPLF